MQWLTLARGRVRVEHEAGLTDGALGTVFIRTPAAAAFLAVGAS